MAKIQKKQEEDHSNDWLNTYADMVTLLLTFFVMLYASSSLDEDKWQLIYQAFQSHGKYLNDYIKEENPVPEEGEGVSSENPYNGGDGTLPQSFDRLYVYLAEYVDQNDLAQSVSVEQGEAHITIRFKDNVLFAPDSSTLTPEGRDMLNQFFPAIRAVETAIQKCTVSGHTADVFSATNDWALSAGRAVNVVNFMQYRGVLDSKKYRALGCGSAVPIGDNSTEEGRNENRRVELTLIKSDIDMTDVKVLQDIMKNDYQIDNEQFDPDAEKTDDGDKLPPGAAQSIINSIEESFPADRGNASDYVGPVLGDYSSFIVSAESSSSDADAGDSGGEGTVAE